MFIVGDIVTCGTEYVLEATVIKEFTDNRYCIRFTKHPDVNCIGFQYTARLDVWTLAEVNTVEALSELLENL